MDLRTPEDFSLAWTDQALRLIRLLSFFDSTDLLIQPHPDAMSGFGQVAHLSAASAFTVDLLTLTTPNLHGFSRLPQLSTAEDCLRQIAQDTRSIQNAALNCSPERWDSSCSVLGPDWTRPRRELAFIMLDHVHHHMGALHVYLRLANKVPPKLYYPVDESLLNRWE